MNYVTTNIRFPEDIYLALKEEAAKKRLSLSAVVREKVGAGDTRRSKAEMTRLTSRLDTTAKALGDKLKGFDAARAIRKMREEL
ncbi:hypothetical protein M1555_03130 [Patescibacteria group bacterium]|nr:hypothetical protein [Patescibacteria group bacterium]